LQTSNEQDDEELSKEFRMLKKLKKGKITEEEFELAVGEKDTEDILQGKTDHINNKQELQTEEPKDTEKNMEPTKIANKNIQKDRNDAQKKKKETKKKAKNK